MIQVEQSLIDSVWNALNADNMRREYSAHAVLQEIAEHGWMYSHQLEDLCYACDPRLMDRRHKVDVDALSKALGYQWSSVTHRPRMRSIEVMLSYALSASEAASFLLQLERLGFNFDAQPLIAALRPGITKKSTITSSELDIFWAAKCRHKGAIFLSSLTPFGGHGDYRRGKLTNGYRYNAMVRADGTVYSLDMYGPQYRERPKPVETVCPECGYKWWRGDPDSSAQHRTEHKKRMHVLAPVPNAQMAQARREEPEPELVRWDSPDWKHFEVYDRARAFKSEEGYDFTQWGGDGGRDTDRNVHGFLFTDDNDVIVGAAAFRWREPKDDVEPPFWGLQWVWVCPPARRQGVLSQRWADLKRRFGEFVVEGPVSKSMQAFLAKGGDTDLMDWPSTRKGSNG